MGTDQTGRSWEVSDPLAQTFAMYMQSSAGELSVCLDAMLGLETVFPEALCEHAGLRSQLLHYLNSFVTDGVRATVARCLDGGRKTNPIEESA